MPAKRAGEEEEDRVSAEDGENTGPIPDLIRRITALGLSSFFTTEEAIRKAVGDTVPQDWVDFASGQSRRTQSELIDRVAREIGRAVQDIDLAQVLAQLLEDRALEIQATVKLGPPGSQGRSEVRLQVREADEER